MRTTLKISLTALCASLVTVLAIYLTPLHNLNIIEPSTHDVKASDFNADFSVHPEKYVFVDVRTQTEYERGHAAGAINVPLPRFFDGYSQFPKHGKEIVLICAGGREAGVGYGYLEHHGYLNLRRIEGGTNEWIAEGLPIVKGPDVR